MVFCLLSVRKDKENCCYCVYSLERMYSNNGKVIKQNHSINQTGLNFGRNQSSYLPLEFYPVKLCKTFKGQRNCRSEKSLLPCTFDIPANTQHYDNAVSYCMLGVLFYNVVKPQDMAWEKNAKDHWKRKQSLTQFWAKCSPICYNTQYVFN